MRTFDCVWERVCVLVLLQSHHNISVLNSPEALQYEWVLKIIIYIIGKLEILIPVWFGVCVCVYC